MSAIHRAEPTYLQPLDFSTHPKKLFRASMACGIAVIPFSALVVLVTMSLKSDTPIKALQGVTAKVILGISIPASIILTVTAGVLKVKQNSHAKRETRLEALDGIDSVAVVDQRIGDVRAKIIERVVFDKKADAYVEAQNEYLIQPEWVTDQVILDVTDEDTSDEENKKIERYQEETQSPIPEYQLNRNQAKFKAKEKAQNTKRLREFLYDFEFLKAKKQALVADQNNVS